VRVGYVVPSLDDTTGWGRWATDFLRHIRALGVEPVIFAPASSQAFLASDLVSIEAVFTLPELFDYVQSSSGLQRLLAGRGFLTARAQCRKLDLVHSLDAHPWGLYGDRLARQHRAPHLLTTHGRYGYIAQNRLTDRWLYGGVLKRAATLVAVSSAVRQSVLGAFASRVADSRVVVMQNPVDAEQFPGSGPPPPGVSSSGPVLISVTRFTPVKDLETAVLAFQRVRRALPDATYFVIGPGNGERNAYYRSVRDLIAREGIEGVHIVGRVSKDVLAAYYRRASLLLHTARTLPDDFEASGLILLEAGLFGLPVVASASGGIPEVVDDGVTGVLVPERDVERLADALVTLLRNPDALARLGAGNRGRARQRNWPTYAEQQEQMYRRLLEHGAA
jgi:starch synthase